MVNNMNQQKVKELFDYENGQLIWKETASSKAVKGTTAGTVAATGYLRIMYEQKIYYAHRLVFLWHNGYLPKYLDHINRNPLDNRIENLREATAHQNAVNRSYKRPKSSRFVGVSKKGNRWIANIYYDKKNHYLGSFKTEEEAAKTYQDKVLEIHGTSWATPLLETE